MKDFTALKYGFVGAGKMASCMIESLVNIVDRKQIFSSTKTSSSAEKISSTFGIEAFCDNDYIKDVDVIFLAIKPNQCDEVLPSLVKFVNRRQIIISVMAGINLIKLQSYFSCIVIRTMPNISVSIQKGILPYCTNSDDKEIQQFMSNIFSQNSLLLSIDEKYINTMTAISGSGPAFVIEFLLYFREYMQSKIFCTQEEAEAVISRLFSGTVSLLEQSSSWEERRDSVVSPKGTTEAGLNCMENLNIKEQFFEFLEAAKNRADELSQ